MVYSSFVGFTVYMTFCGLYACFGRDAKSRTGQSRALLSWYIYDAEQCSEERYEVGNNGIKGTMVSQFLDPAAEKGQSSIANHEALWKPARSRGSA
jgi:hypothetical protein